MSQVLAPVDVIVPMHNAAAFVERALHSVLQQTKPPVRLIVVDDGSTDDGAARVEAVRHGYSGPVSIVLARQANAGPNAARNHGVRLGDAPYVAFLDADDRWRPEKLERQLALLDAGQEDLLMVYCHAEWINETEQPVAGPPLKEAVPLRGRVFERLLERNRITGSASAVLVRRAAFDITGPFDEELLTMEDLDMWLRIADHGRIDLVEEVLVSIRTHASRTTHNAPRMLEGIVRFCAKWYPRAEHLPRVMHEWGHLIALFAGRCADRQAAMSVVNLHLSRAQQQRLFKRALGSLRLYVQLKAMRRWMNPQSA